MDLKTIRSKLDRLKGAKAETEKQISETESEIAIANKHLHHHEKALEIVKVVGLKTQQQLQFHISDITSLALESIFDDPYKLVVEFVERRNKTECDLLFERNGQIMKPIDSSGIGTVDVASFALRVASWSMEHPHSRNTLMMDEPFKYLKGEKENLRVIQMVKDISEKLGLQIIMVHDERVPMNEIEKGADKIFNVTKRNGISKIKEL